MMYVLYTPVKKISPNRRIIRYWIAIAASLLLILLGTTAYQFYSLTSGKIFTANYLSYNLSGTRSGQEPPPSPTEKAFKEKNYREVVLLYETGSDKSPKGKFLAAIACLELNNDSKAIVFFNDIIKQNRLISNPAFNDEAEYYLALSYIRNRDYDLALALMNKIHNDPNHMYHGKISGKFIRMVKMLKWR